MTIKEIRKLSGLPQPKFCEKYGIPLPTLRKWEQGIRKPTDYVIGWLERIVMEDLKMDKMVPMSMIDEMKDLKNALDSVSTKNAADMINNLSQEEKNVLLMVYVFENK